MKRYMKKNRLQRLFVAALAVLLVLSGSVMLPGEAKASAMTKAGTYDATEQIATCTGKNVNKVESYGVKFQNMGQADASAIEGIPASRKIMISGAMAEEKSAFVLEFKKPIDTSKLEYLTIGMFAGQNTKLRVYGSDVKNFIEDTAGDVMEFSTWGIEKKILVLKKFADKDGMVRNLTFYVAKMDAPRSLIIDDYKFTAVKKATKDLVLKATEQTYYSDQNLAKGQLPTYPLMDKGLLKDLGWKNAVYLDGSEDHNWKIGRYVSLQFDQVNTKYYDKIYVDFWTGADLSLTLYAYDAAELNFSKKTADQIVTVKGNEVTTLVFDAKKLADKDGYLSKIHLLLASHTGEDQKAGFQAFFGDMTFRLPRQQAKVTIYTEQLKGGYVESEASTILEGMAGDKVKISPYSAEELGLYGYEYHTAGANVLSGVLKKDKVIELKLYYKLKTCKVTIQNDDEKVVKKVKYGTKLDLMEYRKENKLMHITVDDLELTDTALTITEDTEISITQEAGYYVTFMADGKVYATRTYTGAEGEVFSEPLVPRKKGYEASWEEYTLDGGDKTVNAVYKEATVAGETETDSNVIINVANKMKVAADHSFLVFVLLICGVVVLLALLVGLVVFLMKKGILKKNQVVAGGISLGVCAAVACLVIFVIMPANKGTDTNGAIVYDTPNDYKFEELYTSSEQQTIKPEETLTYEIDKELDEKNYLQIDVDSDVNLIGTISYYNTKDKNQTNVEEFYLEGDSSEAFYQFLDSFRKNASGNFAKHLTQITLKNVSDKEGQITVKKVAVADRIIDLSKAELYVENEYLKAGMDLICGGALTYLEQLPRDGKRLEEVLTSDGDVQVGLDYSKKEGAKLLSDSVNLINIYDKGREVQQSYYADVYEEQGYTRGRYESINREWPYNPVQGGDQDDNSSQIIDYRVEENQLYVKVRAMDWGQHNSTTKSYMENWYSLSDDQLIVKNRFVDWNGFGKSTSAINSEIPAVYFAQAFDTFVTYDGNAPWTSGELDRQSELGSWVDGAYVSENPSEGWFAWVNEEDYGIGMYVPGIKYFASGRCVVSSAASEKSNSNAESAKMLADYRPKASSQYDQAYVYNTDYTAPVITTTMDSYVPMEYSYVIRIGQLESLRSGFQSMDLAGTIDNSGLKVWDD